MSSRDKVMKQFCDFAGRGDTSIASDKYYLLEPDAGAVLLVTRRLGTAEYIVCYCKSVLVEKWGCYCHEPFQRFSDLGFTRSWAERIDSDLMIFHAATVYLVFEEEWMRRSS